MHITSEVRYGSLMTRYVLAATVVLAVTLFSAPARAQSYIVSAADGMDVTWTQRGAAPSGTVQIAACDLTVVMAWDGSQFWSSTRYGQSNTWSVFGTAPPTGLTSITCYDNQLVYLDVDDHLWAYAAQPYGWQEDTSSYSFSSIGGTFGVLIGIGLPNHYLWDFEDTIACQSYWDYLSCVPPRPQWQELNQVSGTHRIVGSRAEYGDDRGRFYAINNDHTLWYSDLVVFNNYTSWSAFPIPSTTDVPQPIQDISAVLEGLYALDNQGHIWTAWANEIVPYNPVPTGTSGGWAGPEILAMIGEYAGQNYQACRIEGWEHSQYGVDGGICCTDPAQCQDHFIPWGNGYYAGNTYSLTTVLRDLHYDAGLSDDGGPYTEHFLPLCEYAVGQWV